MELNFELIAQVIFGIYLVVNILIKFLARKNRKFNPFGLFFLTFVAITNDQVARRLSDILRIAYHDDEKAE